MIGGLALLLLAQLLGEVIAGLSGVPIPGPVVGMLLLFVTLLVSSRKGADACRICPHLESASQGLLAHLSLLFVPAGTGVVAYVALIRQEWLPIAVALLGSTIIAIAVTAITMQALMHHRRPQAVDASPETTKGTTR